MNKVDNLNSPPQPRALISDEELVIFVLDSKTSIKDYEFFNSNFSALIPDFIIRVKSCWKALFITDLGKIIPDLDNYTKFLQLEIVYKELKCWEKAQPASIELQVTRVVVYKENSAYAILIRAFKKETPVNIEGPILIGGKEYRVGQQMTEREAEDLFQSMIAENPGPVTIETSDSSKDTKVVAQVETWTDFTEGPQANEKSLNDHVEYLRKEGYLAFDIDASGVPHCRTPYQALKPQYFKDFTTFIRHQDIPSTYFQPTSRETTVFVSHRWATPAHPDPSGVHFSIIQDFLRRNPSMVVWYDYSCLPQPPFKDSERLLFRESVRNLNSLIMLSQFISIITDDYETRAWCFYEWAISSLLTGGKRGQIKPKAVSLDHLAELVNVMVVEGKYPQLAVTKNEDMADINTLLTAGVSLFKILALGKTLDVLNSFGFSFGLGIAARFSEIIDFPNFWEVWQILAGSSDRSGIRLVHLNDAEKLTLVLKERHERFGTHARIYAEMNELLNRPLDMRIVEQASQDRLSALVAEARRLGPVPSAYTTLAIIKLVYTLAVTRDTPTDIMRRLYALISQLRESQGKSENEIRELLLRVQKEEPKLYQAFALYIGQQKGK
jgi:hypothetical protein